ncbi:peptidylprolyl isomerase [Corynebacterium sp. BF-R-2]|uniref:peptidylprolyl isomerase n=1 Tax=Corynebacterium sp. BF-R-2 TaxID=2943494 RepID=UPI00211F23DA|nr:peptidylprolyl isomerase [Corynebacterium sp. BF-R-2]MCQ9676226.1 peptidylprolyl isomerase [Corynebacterium sp. BF-R-2]
MSTNSQRMDDALNQLDRELKSRDRKQKTRPLGVVIAAAVVIIALVGGIWFLATRSGDEEEIQAQDSSEVETTTEAPTAEALSGKREKPLDETVTCEYPEAGDASREVPTPKGKNIPAKGEVTVNFATKQGDIEMTLDRSLAPCTVNAITDMISAKYYDDTVCHRMTQGGLSVLQCGDPTGQGAGGPGFQFANEYPTDEADDAALAQSAIYPKGSIAMANAGADTNGSQFFINYDDSELPPAYTYFGNLTDKGQKTIDAIVAKGVKDDAPDGAPAEEVRITKATIKS